MGAASQVVRVKGRGQRFLFPLAVPSFMLRNATLRNFILDSGASFHLMPRTDLTPEERKTLRYLSQPAELHTANGIVYAFYECEVYVHDLDTKVTCLVLPDVPPLLSMGKLVRDQGFEFRWQEEQPILVHPESGEEILCSIGQNTPYLCPAESADSEVKAEIEEKGPDEPAASGSTPAPKRRGKGKKKVKKEPKEEPVVKREPVDDDPTTAPSDDIPLLVDSDSDSDKAAPPAPAPLPKVGRKEPAKPDADARADADSSSPGEAILPRVASKKRLRKSQQQQLLV